MFVIATDCFMIIITSKLRCYIDSATRGIPLAMTKWTRGFISIGSVEMYMGDNDGTSASETPSKSKVVRLIQQYDLIDIGEELEHRWTSQTGDRSSLRELADYFNETLLERALQQNTTNTLDGEAANYYRLLTEDEITSGTQIQAQNRLEQHGVDVEQLKTDFVSRQAIHTYLTKERNATYDQPDQSDEGRTEARLDTIGRLKNRLVAVAEQAISELVQSDEVESGDTSVAVLVQVQCTDCDTQYPITQFLTNGGCDCQRTDQ